MRKGVSELLRFNVCGESNVGVLKLNVMSSSIFLIYKRQEEELATPIEEEEITVSIDSDSPEPSIDSDSPEPSIDSDSPEQSCSLKKESSQKI
jgi:hypothetical protein